MIRPYTSGIVKGANQKEMIGCMHNSLIEASRKDVFKILHKILDNEHVHN